MSLIILTVIRCGVAAAGLTTLSAAALALDNSTLQMFRCNSGPVSIIYANPDGTPHPHVDASNDIDAGNTTSIKRYLVVDDKGKLLTVEVSLADTKEEDSLYYGEIDADVELSGKTLYLKLLKNKPNSISLRLWSYSFEAANLEQDSECVPSIR